MVPMQATMSQQPVIARSQFVAFVAFFALLIGMLGAPVTASAAPPTLMRTDMKVLVVQGASTAPYEYLMTRDGIPFDVLPTASINAGALVDTSGAVPHAKYQAVIVPDMATDVGSSWRTALAAYESTYGIRQLAAYVYPNSLVGLNEVPEPSCGSADGKTALVTAAGLSGPFNYLKGPVPFDTGSWLCEATAAGAGVTSFVTRGTGIVVGVFANSGVDTMFVTFSANSNQSHLRLLGPGILNWLTAGNHLGLNRAFLAVHADDAFGEDSRWSVTGNCTPGDTECSATTTDILMNASDVTQLKQWQSANAVKVDLAYNAEPAVLRNDAAVTGSLTKALLDDKASFRWINHTFGHKYLGCATTDTAPFNCLTEYPDVNQPLNAALWTQLGVINADITTNLNTAPFSTLDLDPTELVTGEHSGLADTNTGRRQADNPNLIAAVNNLGIKVLASDASKESTQRSFGSAVTLPRYPNNLYYNVGTGAELVDEYNWIYTSAADGGSGICTTLGYDCVTPVSNFATDIAPLEAKATLNRVLNNDPRPHYVHQSNFAEERLAYTWLNLVLSNYNAAVVVTDMPIVNPTMTAAALALTQQVSWSAIQGGVTAYIKGGQIMVTTPTAGWVPLSAATGKVAGSQNLWGDAYGGTRSKWTYLTPGETLTVDVAANTLPTAAFTFTCPTDSLTCSVDGSTSADPDGTVATYHWDFGDGTPMQVTTTPTAAHSYLSAGTPTVTLTVTDNRGGTSLPVSQVVNPTGTNQLPTAVAAASCTGLTCSFDASKSSDGDGSIATYGWDFGDNTPIATGANPKAEHTYPTGGTYTAKLTVTDNKGGTGVTSVIVKPVSPNKAPTASFTVTCVGLNCAADGSGSSDPDGKVVSHQWTFGDGSAAAGAKPGTHTYVTAGTYMITLSVFDDLGASASTSKSVTVQAPAAPPVTTAPSAPTGPTPTVKIKTVKKKSKIRIDVDPNKGTKYWKFKVQKLKKDGTWKQYKKTYRTVGKKERKTVNRKKGTYRVMVLPRFGYQSVTSAQVYLKR